MQYRIVEKVSYDGEHSFVVEKRFLFLWWLKCEKWSDVSTIFSSQKKAEDFIKNRSIPNKVVKIIDG